MASDPRLAKRFLEPPADCRMLRNLHGWPQEAAAQEKQIRQLHAQGFGGVVTNVALDHGYVENPDNWNALLAALVSGVTMGG